MGQLSPPKLSVGVRITLGVLIILAFAEMAALSLARFHGFNTGGDLGNMSQSIWSATRGEPLIFTLEGVRVSRLARHVELIYFLLAPLYALFPTPATLLIVQSALYAGGALPVFRLAHRRLHHSGAGIALALIYLLYPVAQTAVLYDFHADTLAMPLLFFAIEALDRRAWREYTFWITLALAAKVYVAAPVAALGVVIWLNGDRRRGGYTLAGAALWGVVAFVLIRPLFAVAGDAGTQTTVADYVGYYFGQLSTVGETFSPRMLNAIIVFLPVMVVGWRVWRWLIPALAVALPVLISTGPGPVYDYRYHHYALIVPFLLTSIVYGAVSLQAWQSPQEKKFFDWRAGLGVTLLLTVLLNVLFVDSPLNPAFFNPPPGAMFGVADTRYGVTPRDRFRAVWLAENVPPAVPLAADARSVSHVVNRRTLFLTTYKPDAPGRNRVDITTAVDYAVTDALTDFAIGSSDEITFGGVEYEWESIRRLLTAPSMKLLKAQDGLLLFGKNGDGLLQTVDVLPEPPASAPLATFGDEIAILNSRIEPLGARRYRFQFDWMALHPLDGQPPLFAVSRLAGVAHARIPHLPTAVLHPTGNWQPKTVVRETFEIALPADLPPGDYPLWVGWYNSGSFFAAQTDARSRVGDEFLAGTVEVK